MSATALDREARPRTGLVGMAIFLVTDAMAPAGTDLTEFTLGGRPIYRRQPGLRQDLPPSGSGNALNP